MIKLTATLVIAFGFLLCAGCGKVDCVTYDSSLGIYFSGYDSDTGVQVILSKYPQSASVPNYRDTFRIDSNRTYRQIRDSSTVRWMEDVPSVYEGISWEVYVPSTGKRDIISGIEFTDDTRKKELMEGGGWGDQCFDVCKGYYLNGNYVATGHNAAVSSYGAVPGVSINITK